MRAKNMDDYISDQVKRLRRVDQYGIQIKLTTTSGATNWITLSKENYKERLNALVSGVEKIFTESE